MARRRTPTDEIVTRNAIRLYERKAEEWNSDPRNRSVFTTYELARQMLPHLPRSRDYDPQHVARQLKRYMGMEPVPVRKEGDVRPLVWRSDYKDAFCKVMRVPPSLLDDPYMDMDAVSAGDWSRLLADFLSGHRPGRDEMKTLINHLDAILGRPGFLDITNVALRLLLSSPTPGHAGLVLSQFFARMDIEHDHQWPPGEEPPPPVEPGPKNNVSTRPTDRAHSRSRLEKRQR